MPREKQVAKPVELKEEELKGIDGGTLNPRAEDPTDKNSDVTEQVEEL